MEEGQSVSAPVLLSLCCALQILAFTHLSTRDSKHVDLHIIDVTHSLNACDWMCAYVGVCMWEWGVESDCFV